MVKKRKKVDFSLVVPVYNETLRLLDGFSQIVGFLKKEKRRSWELILVDDGSDTPVEEILFSSQFARRAKTLLNTKKLVICRLSVNYGKGRALSVGVATALGEAIIFSDIDCSVPIEGIPIFLSALRRSEIAIGSRRLPGSHIVVHQPFLREAAGRVYTAFSNTICNTRVSDATCGFKAFRKHVAHTLFGLGTINRWAFDSEILFLARKKGYALEELPVAWRNKEGSKVRLKDTAGSFFDLLRIRWNDMVGKYE